MTDEFNETPWTERQWEAFLRESELRSARFADLFETLLDHPERDELIAHEMGWDHDGEEPEFELPSDEELQFDEEDEEELQERKSDLRALPAYKASLAWGLRIQKLLANGGEQEADLDEIVARALESCLSVAAKVAAGQALGEEDQSLCGNIVCCKRAATFADQGLEALAELAQRGCFPRETMQPLIDEGQRIRVLLEERIRELRTRVWWE